MDRLTVRRVVGIGAIASALVACNGSKSKGPPPLPSIPKLEPGRPASDRNADPGYRRQGGQGIAPVVIADDPVAPQAVPTVTGHPGGSNQTLNGDPRGITRETLNRSIQGAMGALAGCFANITHAPMVAVSFEADPNGRPSLVRVNGAPPDAERCIRGVVQGIRFPSFDGKGVQVDLPLSFHRTTGTPQTVNQPAKQAAAPPLFLDP